MARLPLFAASALVLGGCVTNIESKAEAVCGPLRQNAAVYNDCYESVSAQMRAKNRRTARILAAGLGGAAQGANQSTATPQGLFLQREYVSGMNKICVYRSIRGEEAVTIDRVQLCPLSR